MRISLKEALLGFDKEIPHLDDHIVTVKKNGVTQPGDVIKVRGEGKFKVSYDECKSMTDSVFFMSPYNFENFESRSLSVTPWLNFAIKIWVLFSDIYN